MAASIGDDWNGDESVLSVIFLDDDVQLGELRRFSVAEISDSGRPRPTFVGECVGVLFEMRRGSVMGCSEAILK